MNNKIEYILCAAIRYKDDVCSFILPGRRHSDCFKILKLFKYSFTPSEVEKGFLTSYDRFVDIIEAVKIAFTAKQIDQEVNILISEDLY